MTDQRLRELERRWLETGTDADEGAYLQECVRAGRLSPARLTLAAYCGHPALGGPEDPTSSLGVWVERMPFAVRSRRVDRNWARIPIAAARALEPVGRVLGASAVLSQGLNAAEALLLDGGQIEAACQTREVLRDDIYTRQPDSWDTVPPDVALVWLVEVAFRALIEGVRSITEFQDRAKVALYPEGVWSVQPGVEDALESCFPRAEGRLWGLRLAIRDELVPWALGYGDPVAERVTGQAPPLGKIDGHVQ